MVTTGPSVVTGATGITRDPSQLHQDHRLSHGLWPYSRPRSPHGYWWQARHLPQYVPQSTQLFRSASFHSTLIFLPLSHSPPHVLTHHTGAQMPGIRGTEWPHWWNSFCPRTRNLGRGCACVFLSLPDLEMPNGSWVKFLPPGHLSLSSRVLCKCIDIICVCMPCMHVKVRWHLKGTVSLAQ